jgi:hypothetical protein
MLEKALQHVSTLFQRDDPIIVTFVSAFPVGIVVLSSLIDGP